MRAAFDLWEDFGLAPYNPRTKRLAPQLADCRSELQARTRFKKPHNLSAYTYLPGLIGTWEKIAVAHTD